MKATVIAEGAERVLALVFDRGEEFMGGLTAFASRESMASAHFTAIGAFSSVVLGYFDRDRKNYRKIPLDEQVEVLSLAGDIALSDGKPKIHGHAVIGMADGSTRGGHLLEGHVWPTLEVVLEESSRKLVRKTDAETGLALIDIEATRSARPLGHRRWAIADGYIPGWSHGPAPQMVSHEAVCILNASDTDAHVTLTIYFSNREPAGPYRLTVPARRTLHQRFNNLTDPEPIPVDSDYSSLIESDVPIVVQQTRLDSRQAENGLMSTMAYALG